MIRNRFSRQAEMGRLSAHLFLSFLTQTQQVIGADTVVLAQSNQMMDRKLIGTALVAGIHGLRGSQDFGDLRLRFIGILSQVSQNANIVHSVH